MKTFIIISIFLLIVAQSFAALGRGQSNDKENPGKCVFKELNLILSPGDIVQHPSACGRILCYDQGMYEQQSCGAIGPPPGCVLGKPLKPDAPYPDCCGREFICDETEKNN